MPARTTDLDTFFVTGGTLPADASSYVERAADRDLLSSLLAGEYCYVLNSRQMGKSSLSVRTITRLREAGVRTAFVDLTRIGAQNVTAEQWYAGLLAETGRALNLRDAFLKHWKEHGDLPPVHRYFGALREIALTTADTPLVVFVDEIDAVRSLSFSADEFFAAVRASYNGRTEDARFQRLTFCLVGAATPADLIVDTRISPFNIGSRIELRDFTPGEAESLARGLGQRGRELVARILYWTGGHPYMTQRICRACSESEANRPSDVDVLCAQLFFTHSAKESDDNLSFVRNRLLKSEADVASLLDMYLGLRRGRGIEDDETNPLVSVIKLSGVCMSSGGRLRIRNRIYDRVFDPAWVNSHMPDAEVRRVRAAYKKGWLRAVAGSSVIIAAIAVLAVLALRYARRADNERLIANQAQGREAAGRTRMEAMVYAYDMNVAQQACDWGNLERARTLIKRNRPDELRPVDFTLPGRSTGMRKDRRGFEWRYLWRLSRGDEIATVLQCPGPVQAVAFSTDGMLAAFAAGENTVRIWDQHTKREVGILKADDQVVSVVFSTDGKTLITGGSHGAISVWSLASGRALATADNHGDGICCVAAAPDGLSVAVGHKSGTVSLWSANLTLKTVLQAYKRPVNCVAFSPDSRLVATGSDDSRIEVWDTRTHLPQTLGTGQGSLSLAFSPHSKLLAAGGTNGTVEVWDTASRTRKVTLLGHKSQVNCVAFAPDGRSLATGSWDYTIGLWDPSTGRNRSALRGHTGIVRAVMFSPGGKTLLSGSSDRTIKLWSTLPKADGDVLAGHTSRVSAISFSADKKTFASGGEDCTVRLWTLGSGQADYTLRAGEPVVSVALSPDGGTLVGGLLHGTTVVWDLKSRRVSNRLTGDGTRVTSTAYSADGKYFAVGYVSGDICLYEAATNLATRMPGAHKGPVTALVFSPDSKGVTQYSDCLFSIGEDNLVKIWSRRSPGSPVMRDTRPIASPRGIAITPDGRTLSATSAEGYVDLWDLWAGSPGIPHVLSVPSPTGVAFSADGRTIAIGSFDKTIRMWNVPGHDEWILGTHQEMLTLKGHVAPVTNLAFSPDGNLLASAGWESPIHLWRASSFADTDAK